MQIIFAPQHSRYTAANDEPRRMAHTGLIMMSSQKTSVEQESSQLQQYPSRRVLAQTVLAAALALHSLPGLAVEVCTN